MGHSSFLLHHHHPCPRLRKQYRSLWAIMVGFAEHCVDFRKYHQTSLNVALHLVTTPACLFAALGLTDVAAQRLNFLQDASFSASTAVAVSYLALLFLSVPLRLWMATVATFAGLLWLLQAVQLNVAAMVITFISAYVAQDLAHFITGEPSYQSSYAGQSNFILLLAEHTFFLLPLVFDACNHMSDSFLSWFASHNYVVYTRLNEPSEKSDMRDINDWVMSQKPTTAHTTHFWFQERPGTQPLPKRIYDAFTNVALSKSMLGMYYARFNEMAYAVERVSDMDEIYVASPNYNNKNSDTVFYMRHIDGPYLIFPFARVYRTILAISPNDMIATTCPMQPATHTLSTGDALGLDFNREVHFIHNHEGVENKGFRITLKVHYVVYPKCLRSYGRLLAVLTTRYDETARNLFLNTIRPKNLFWQAAAYYVLFSTLMTQLTMEYLGMENLAYILIAYGASWYTGNPMVFVALTSFVHYLYYIGTYYHRKNISHGYFKRDVMLFKGVAVAHLFTIYLTALYKDYNGENANQTAVPAGSFDPAFNVSVGCIAVGYAILMSATRALGWDQTYFGVELGVCKARWVTDFPYGPLPLIGLRIPHPMILGQCLAYYGMHYYPGFRAQAPLLVPLHVALYCCHLLQEVSEFHCGSVSNEGLKGDEAPVGRQSASDSELPGDFNLATFNKHGFLEGKHPDAFLYPVRSRNIHFEG